MIKTQQRFEYTVNGESKGYLLMPNEYSQCLGLMSELDKSVEYVAGWAGLSTKYIDKGSLKLIQIHLDRK